MLKLKKFPTLSDLDLAITASSTVSEAYELIKYIEDNSKGSLKLVNTGTIDKYVFLWGHKLTKYIKRSYKYPTINDEYFKNKLNRKIQSLNSKIIIAGMSKEIECVLDKGGIVAGKSTIIVRGNDQLLRILTGYLNSSLASFFLKYNYNSLQMAGGYLNITPSIISSLPVCNDFLKINEIPVIVDNIQSLSQTQDYLTNEGKKSQVKLLQIEIDQLIYKLYELTDEEIKIVEEETKHLY